MMLKFPDFATLYCTADAILLAPVRARLFNPSLKRVVVFSSTSVITKLDTEVAAEREMFANAGGRRTKDRHRLKQASIDWTILRPTLIYARGATST